MRTVRLSSYLVLAVALSLVPATVTAALTEVGFKGGLSAATLHGRLPTGGLIENSSKLGFGGGVWLTIPLGRHFSLQPELARVSFATPGLASPYLLVGPVVGVRLSQQLRITGDISIGADIDFYRSVDVGAALGTGLELGRGQVRGALEARYTPGLTPNTEDFYSGDARNGALLVTMSLALRR